MSSETGSHSASACEPLDLAPYCAGCGMEAEVVNYFRCQGCKVRVGFTCTCGAHVVRGVVLALMGAGAY